MFGAREFQTQNNNVIFPPAGFSKIKRFLIATSLICKCKLKIQMDVIRLVNSVPLYKSG